MTKPKLDRKYTKVNYHNYTLRKGHREKNIERERGRGGEREGEGEGERER
jgi:hypothetical protein